MSKQANQFYQSLATDYRLIFADWHQTVSNQANIIGDMLRKFSIKPPATILDCTCGIGTQAIGLATIGYTVHGTDLSSEAIALAKQYKDEFETPITPTFAVADLLDSPGLQRYDAVIAMDNAIAHFMTDTDLTQAFANMYAQLNPDGLLILSLRDYDAIIKNPPRSTAPSVIDTPSGRRIVYQAWDVAANKTSYDAHLFITEQQGNTWHTRSHTGTMRLLLRKDVEMALEVNQFKELIWLMPDESSFYQPVLIARK
ncbi:MAG: class I SAM-dependent methyltransferase [Aggregatilineales bacterium]